MKRTLITIIAILAGFAQLAFSQTPDGYADADVSISFYDRTMYYPSSTDDNPIYVHVAIANKGTETLRFKLADDRMFSMDFTAYTIKNSSLPRNESLVIKRSSNQTVYFREVAIEPGEEYSFIENVKDYVAFAEPSMYYLELSFYPELYKMNTVSLSSNRLSLEIRPAPSAAASSFHAVASGSASLLKPEAISPDKVIEQTIIARQKSLWDQYFLYMDVEQMMLRNADVSRKYNAASASERARLLDTYRADLMQNRIDYDIVAVPERFSIENTSYTQVSGTVTVTEWFRYPNFSERKRYVYKLRQRDGIWQIYDYNVTNLGTE